MGYADLRELQTALTTASDIASSLQAAPTRRDADQLVDVLRQALTAASSLSTLTGPTGCAIHPNGAVDPLYGDPEDPLPPGYGKCLLCNDRRRRADAKPHQPYHWDRSEHALRRSA
ncbi:MULTISPECIES: hypothetical protein [Streptomyces]|uniref:Uncharacterized protein n=2 Tax=Streptomyces rimosus subsp. rimosus TaxID=132474 RepID=L8EP90_STRR1|nr:MULTISPECIES: hypothetical protein [Streptomyces]KOG68017.1 hypothetical protein ADK78_38150 [Kitasatospora aureofaciens]MYT46387.1 hypothetical protein [Streptomyces sp. SID5471]KEF06483.1 hypothetical protein DF17_14285 [Streptomyces rimosus]KEF21530.1 hypothetical protein DF18_05080 [Streptomyces rimosus]KOT32838.1 hypothetical protein ADK42_25610 [Streptomyces rimosus subsp. rimosus]